MAPAAAFGRHTPGPWSSRQEPKDPPGLPGPHWHSHPEAGTFGYRAVVTSKGGELW